MNKPSSALLDIKFAKIKAVTFALRPAPLQESIEALKKRLGPTPGVYSAEPAVLDFSGWNNAELNEHGVELKAYAEILKAAGVLLVEVRGQSEALETQAEELGVRFETAEADQAEPEAALKSAPPPETPEAAITETHTAAETDSTPVSHPAVPSFDNPRRTMVIDQSVRSGQKVYAQGADLVIMGQVSAGAEVIADGHIHVYAPLRGKAMAGARGHAQARIFSLAMAPELISIAGVYRTSEVSLPQALLGRPAQVRLHSTADGDRLVIDALST